MKKLLLIFVLPLFTFAQPFDMAIVWHRADMTNKIPKYKKAIEKSIPEHSDHIIHKDLTRISGRYSIKQLQNSNHQYYVYFIWPVKAGFPREIDGFSMGPFPMSMAGKDDGYGTVVKNGWSAEIIDIDGMDHYCFRVFNTFPFSSQFNFEVKQ